MALTAHQADREILEADTNRARELVDLAIANVDKCLKEDHLEDALDWILDTDQLEMKIAYARVMIALQDFTSARGALTNLKQHPDYDVDVHLPIVAEMEVKMLIDTKCFELAQRVCEAFGNRKMCIYKNSVGELVSFVEYLKDGKKAYKHWIIEKMPYFRLDYIKGCLTHVPYFQLYRCFKRFWVQMLATYEEISTSWRFRDSPWVKDYLNHHDEAKRKEARHAELIERNRREQVLDEASPNNFCLIRNLPIEILGIVTSNLPENFNPQSGRFELHFVSLGATCKEMRLKILESVNFWRDRCKSLWRINTCLYLESFPMEWKRIYMFNMSVLTHLKSIDYSSRRPPRNMLKHIEWLSNTISMNECLPSLERLLGSNQLEVVILKVVRRWRLVCGEELAHLLLVLVLEDEGYRYRLKLHPLIYMLRSVVQQAESVCPNAMGLIALITLLREEKLELNEGEQMDRLSGPMEDWVGWIVHEGIKYRGEVDRIWMKMDWGKRKGTDEAPMKISAQISTLGEVECRDVDFVSQELLGFTIKVRERRWDDSETEMRMSLNWLPWGYAGALHCTESVVRGGVLLFPRSEKLSFGSFFPSVPMRRAETPQELEQRTRLDRSIYCIERVWNIDETQMTIDDLILVEELARLQDGDNEVVVSEEQVDSLTKDMPTNAGENPQVLIARKKAYTKIYISKVMKTRQQIAEQYRESFIEDMNKILSKRGQQNMEAAGLVCKWSSILYVVDPHSPCTDEVDTLLTYLRQLS